VTAAAIAIDKDGCDIMVETLSRYLYNTISDLPAEKRPKQAPLWKAEASGDTLLTYFPQSATKLIADIPVSSLDTADIITKGNDYLDKKEYQKTSEHHQKVITDPNLAKAWINKGIALQT